MTRTPAAYRLAVTVPAELSAGVSELFLMAGASAVEERDADEGAELIIYGERAPALRRIRERVRRALAKAGLSFAREAGPEAVRVTWESAPSVDQPVPISRGLVLVPGAAERPVGQALAVRLEPAFAFGFGDHPTTRMAARFVEKHCRREPPFSVLDVGTGTGVLGIVAALLGARRVLGIDTDPRAARSARRNAAQNAVGERCRFTTTPLARVRGLFDLVVANLDYRTLMALPRALRAVTRRGGTLLVTGFLGRDRSDVVRAFEQAGFERARGGREGEWALAAFTLAGAPRARRSQPGSGSGTTRTTRNRSPVPRASPRARRRPRRTSRSSPR